MAEVQRSWRCGGCGSATNGGAADEDDADESTAASLWQPNLK